jgi:hypothetical protein
MMSVSLMEAAMLAGLPASLRAALHDSVRASLPAQRPWRRTREQEQCQLGRAAGQCEAHAGPEPLERSTHARTSARFLAFL